MYITAVAESDVGCLVDASTPESGIPVTVRTVSRCHGVPVSQL
jgi:hypothetical protein